MSQASKDCGRSLTITNTANGKSVVAIVQDACPSCVSKYSLDMSTGAFDAIGDRDTGILPISWKWNNVSLRARERAVRRRARVMTDPLASCSEL